MLTRRSFLAASLGLAVAGRARSTTPEASPQATPTGDYWRVTGEGMLKSSHGTPRLEIDLTFDKGAFEGGFELSVFPVEGTEWLVESTELVRIRPISAMSPHITRITGYCTLNGADEAPFVLDLAKGRGDDPDSLKFVSGEEAQPLLGEELKQGCDCGPIGVTLESPFVEGGFEVQRQ